MNPHSDLGMRIKMLVETVGSAEELARRVGVSGRMIGKYIAGSEPGRDIVEKLVEASGVRMEWLVSGEEPMYSTEVAREAVGGYSTRVHRDLVFIPMMQGRISAGGGLVPDERPEIALAFRRDWISRKGDPRNMSVIRVKGDSMSPTLQEGDVILVNHNIKSVTPDGGIFAITDGGQISVKRIAVNVAGGMLYIISDNKELYSPYPADPAQVIINGKVIWYGRDLER